MTWGTLADRLDDFAIRCFRDTGDRDYIAARLAFQARLMPQFLWAGLQAIEKYFKCIQVLNRIPKPKKPLKHHLAPSYELISRECPFDMRLSERTTEIIRQLDTYGKFRYLDISWHVLGYERFRLDGAVWEIRRYCRRFNESRIAEQLAEIEASESLPPHRFRLPGGLLERILEDKRHPARPALVWHNYYFTSRSRKRVRVGGLHAENSPLWLYPDMIDEVCKFAYLERDVIDAYRQRLAEKRKGRTVRIEAP